jgi:hypothetical protein
LGNVLFDLKNNAGALAAFEKALEIRRGLSDIPNGDPRWQLGKFYSLLYTSDAMRSSNPVKALSLAREALQFANGMVGSDQKKVSWRTELSLAQEQVKRLEADTKK